jgi:enoyl-CoA hydratase
VRALIIDKDNSPHWQPARLEDVTDAMVEAFFRRRWTAAAHPLAIFENP